MNQRASARLYALKVSSSLVTFPLLAVPTENPSLTQACIKLQAENGQGGWELSRNDVHPGCSAGGSQQQYCASVPSSMCTPNTCEGFYDSELSLCHAVMPPEKSKTSLRSCNISNISVRPFPPTEAFPAPVCLQPHYYRLNPRMTLSSL